MIRRRRPGCHSSWPSRRPDSTGAEAGINGSVIRLKCGEFQARISGASDSTFFGSADSDLSSEVTR